MRAAAWRPRALVGLLPGLAVLGLLPACGFGRAAAGLPSAPHQGLAVEGQRGREVLYGNGDDLPGFGAYKRISRSGTPLPVRLNRVAFNPEPDSGIVESGMPCSSPAASRFLFLLSIVIAFCGSTLTVMGMVVQKYAHQSLDEAEDEVILKNCPKNCLPRGCYIFSWRWLFGLTIFGLGNIVTWVALGMGPNSVLASFNSWNIIFAMVVAPMWFGERVPLGAKLSAVVLIGGCIWVTIAGPRSYRLQTIDSINMLFAQFPFTLCCIICCTILVAAKIKHWLWQGTKVWSPIASVQITSMASIFGSYAVLFSKCTSMLVQSSVISNVSQVGYWQFYLWGAATVVCGACQIYFLNESLRHGPVSFVIPAYESMGMALQIMVGGIFFREYWTFTLTEHMAFWPGVVLVLSGLVFLTRSVAPTEADVGEAERAPSDGGRPDAAA